MLWCSSGSMSSTLCSFSFSVGLPLYCFVFNNLGLLLFRVVFALYFASSWCLLLIYNNTHLSVHLREKKVLRQYNVSLVWAHVCLTKKLGQNFGQSCACPWVGQCWKEKWTRVGKELVACKKKNGDKFLATIQTYPYILTKHHYTSL